MTFVTDIKKKYVVAFKPEFKVGNRVEIAINSGCLSGKKGIVVDQKTVKTDGRGVPTNIPGAYKPVDWADEIAIKLDDGELTTMYKNRVKEVKADLDEDGYESWETPEDEDKESEDDAYLSPSGHLGSKISLSIGGKHIGEFKSNDEAEDAFAAWVNKNKFFPNIWYVSDHGNVHQYTMSKENLKKIKM